MRSFPCRTTSHLLAKQHFCPNKRDQVFQPFNHSHLLVLKKTMLSSAGAHQQSSRERHVQSDRQTPTNPSPIGHDNPPHPASDLEPNRKGPLVLILVAPHNVPNAHLVRTRSSYWLLMLLMLGVGASLETQAFQRLKEHPNAHPRFLAQFGWMPLLAFISSKVIGASPKSRWPGDDRCDTWRKHFKYLRTMPEPTCL